MKQSRYGRAKLRDALTNESNTNGPSDNSRNQDLPSAAEDLLPAAEPPDIAPTDDGANTSPHPDLRQHGLQIWKIAKRNTAMLVNLASDNEDEPHPGEKRKRNPEGANSTSAKITSVKSARG